MPKDGTSADIRWYPVHPRWGWHVGNAYEDRTGRDRAARHQRRRGRTGRPPGRSSKARAVGRAKGRLYEWTLDPRTGRVSERFLSDVADRVPDHQRQPHRRGEPLRLQPDHPADPTPHNRIIKNDIVTGAEQAHYLGAGQVSGEAVFVPSRHPSCEDDGWLITIVHDLTRPAAALVILDASAPAARPVATVHLPRRVPFGYHGEWIDDAAIGLA